MLRTLKTRLGALAGAAVLGGALVAAGPAGVANAQAIGISPTNSGPAIGVRGLNVTIPFGTVHVEVEGDDLHIEEVSVGYVGETVSDLKFSWTLEDSQGVVYKEGTMEGDSGRAATAYIFHDWPDGFDAADSGKLCGHVEILGAHAGTSCVKIYESHYWNWRG